MLVKTLILWDYKSHTTTGQTFFDGGLQIHRNIEAATAHARKICFSKKSAYLPQDGQIQQLKF